MRNNQTKKVTFAAMFLTLALVLPFFTGQIPQIGSMLCPMHIPVLLAGYICGGPWGFVIGLIAPILRSLIFGMPPMFPTAVSMAFELAAYGLVAGVLHKLLPPKKWCIYISLLLAMIAGRMVWGLAMFVCMGLKGTTFGMTAFLAGAVYNAIPGIIVQIILIPIIVMLLKRTENRDTYE